MALLFPKRTKHRKMHRGRMKGKATRGAYITFGEYGIQALEPAWITGAQIEACRTTIAREAWRQDLDSHLPGQADHQTSCGSAHGQG